MKKKQELNIPDDRHYTKEHVWIKKDGDSYLAGISDYAQDQLGEVVFVDLPAGGQSLKAASEFGNVESVKSVNDLYMPVDGKIIEVNEVLADEPGLVNADCYGKAWLVRIQPDNPADVDKLPDAASYLAILE